jgi:aromatic-L-amino-acid/L-tryptophan decarboxylase
MSYDLLVCRAYFYPVKQLNKEQQIKESEQLSKALSPDISQRAATRDKVIQYTETFLEALNHKKAYVVTADKGKALLDSPVSEDGADIETLIALIKRNVDEPGLNPASGGHLGYIPGGGIYTAALGDYMADISNRYSGIFFASPGAVRMENMLVKWMCDIAGYPATAGGTLTSGGSIANLIGIVTARDTKGIKAGDVERSVIYTTTQVHHSANKAIRIAGLGECLVRNIALDSMQRMDAMALERSIIDDLDAGLNPFLIIASMGTTDTGAIDPIEAISNIAGKYKLWLHVDAAYGGFFLLCDEVKQKVKGIEKADSIVMDPHKGLFLPYGSGAILIKDQENLARSQYYTANYMQDAKASSDEISPAEVSPELTRHFRGMRLWLPLKLHGVSSFRAALKEKLLLARYFHDAISRLPGFEVLNYPELSVVAFRYIPKDTDPDRFNKKLVEEIQKDGRVFLSSTLVNGNYTIRLAVLSFRTHLDTIKLALQILTQKISQVEDDFAEIEKRKFVEGFDQQLK